MDTNSNIPVEKKIVSVEILHLDKPGYGPQGKHTRKKWREECLENLLAGKDQFLAWQKSWEGLIDDSIPRVSFEYRLDDGHSSSGNYIDSYSYFYQQHPYDLDFSGHHFEDLMSFVSIEFLQNTLFVGARFGSFAYFSGVTFRKIANFTNTIFSDSTVFESSKFDGNAFFNNSKLNNIALFNTVTFSDIAVFKNTTFKDTLMFAESTFHKRVHFGGASFKNECSFYNSNFKESANFESAIFSNVGHFEKAKFLKITPSFRGCKIGDTRLEFSDDSYFPQNEKSEDAIKNISFLKRLSEEHGQTEQALNFNALELRAKAASDDASWNFKIVTWLYKNLSDFGRSFLKPLGVYAGILFFTFLIALEHSAYNAPRNYTQQGCDKYIWWIERVSFIYDKNCLDKPNSLQLTGIRAASEYTLYRAAGVLDFSDSDKQTKEVALRLFGQEIEPWWMRIWGVFKAIASTALLFLAALGLRNKYRIK